MTDTSPLNSTGPRIGPRTSLAAIADRLRSYERRLKFLEKNRTPQPVPMGGVANAPRMAMAQFGHAPVFSDSQGAYVPSPVLAELLFHLPGDLIEATSDPLHSRYPCNVLAVSADLTTYISDVTFEVLVNGTGISTVVMTGTSTGLIPVSDTPALAPYTDLVTIETTDVGGGNAGLVVHVELGVVAGSVPGP